MWARVLFTPLVQAASLLLALALRCFPKHALANLRRRGRSALQAKRHFVAGAQLLARSRFFPNPNTRPSLAKSAAAEAALAIDPRDAAPHVLKSLALHLIGHKTSTLRSLDAALSLPASKSILDAESAELQIEINRRCRIDAAVSDLVDALRRQEFQGLLPAWKLLRDEGNEGGGAEGIRIGVGYRCDLFRNS